MGDPGGRRRLFAPFALSTACALAAAGGSGCGYLYDRVGGAFRGEPEELASRLSPAAARLLDGVLEGLGDEPIVDAHVHFVSAEVAPSWLSFWHPIRRARLGVYLSAAGVAWRETLAADYEARLIRLLESSPRRIRCFIYALDYRYRADGTPDVDATPLHVSNDLVMAAAARRPDLFVPVISVHPYRPDALRELERLGRAGARAVKWLPNTMGIDPSSPRIEPYYRQLRRLGMVLFTHTGEESALEADDPHLGNPLLLRTPLSMGVRVVALHMGSDGDDIDLESPGRERVASFDLLLRLFDDPRYDGLLFGDTAALTFYNHLARPLRVILDRDDLQRRLIHGSDYPLCAINMAHRTSSLRRWGFITREEASALDEVYAFNPLLFDLAVKRTVKHPVTGKRLAASVFRWPPELGGPAAPSPRSAARQSSSPLPPP